MAARYKNVLRLLGGLELILVNRDCVASDRHTLRHVVTLIVGLNRLGYSRLFIGDGDLGVGHDPARLVGDGSINRAEDIL